MAVPSVGWRWPESSAARSTRTAISTAQACEHGRLGACSRSRATKRPRSPSAANGDIVAVAKVDAVKPATGSAPGKLPPPARNRPAAQLRAGDPARRPQGRRQAVGRPGAHPRGRSSLTLEQDEASHEMRLRGVNDEHLKTACAKLNGAMASRYQPSRPIGYRGSIRKPVTPARPPQEAIRRAWPIGDVIIEIRRSAAREGFRFDEKIHGGAIPKPVDPGGRARRQGRHGQGPARLPGGRRCGDPGRRQLPQRGFERAGLPVRWTGRDAGSAGAGRPHLLEPVQKLVLVRLLRRQPRSSAVASRRGQMLGMGPREAGPDGTGSRR